MDKVWFGVLAVGVIVRRDRRLLSRFAWLTCFTLWLLTVGAVPLSLLLAPHYAYSMSKEEMLKPLISDVIMGNSKANVTVIEYHSMTCPHCSYFHSNVMPRIMEKFVDSGKIAYIVREYPVDMQSFDATLVMRCIKKDKVKAFRAVLFANQKEWLGKKQHMDMFKNYASLSGVDPNNLNACIQDDKIKNAVFNEKLDAIKYLGVTNIPTFFVNGQKYEGARPWEFWDSLISGAIDDASSAEKARREMAKDLKQKNEFSVSGSGSNAVHSVKVDVGQ